MLIEKTFMTLWQALVLGTALLVPEAGVVDEPRPPRPLAQVEQASERTVVDMRNVGTALFSWLTDEIESEDAVYDSQVDLACLSPEAERGPCQVVQIDKLPLISLEELKALLVPKYILVIPEQDGWGHPYEYRVDRKNVLNRNVLAIRSAGQDGVFSGNRYELGTFPPGEAHQDLVWQDGFFIRWPVRQAIKPLRP